MNVNLRKCDLQLPRPIQTYASFSNARFTSFIAFIPCILRNARSDKYGIAVALSGGGKELGPLHVIYPLSLSSEDEARGWKGGVAVHSGVI